MRAIIFFALIGLFAFFAYEAPEAVTPPSNVQGGVVAAEQNTVQAPAADGWLGGEGIEGIEGIEGDEGDEGIGDGATSAAPEEVIVEETEEAVPEVVDSEEAEEPIAEEIEEEEPYVAPTLPEAALVLGNEGEVTEEQSVPPEEEWSIVEQLINASESQPQPQPQP